MANINADNINNILTLYDNFIVRSQEIIFLELNLDGFIKVYKQTKDFRIEFRFQISNHCTINRYLTSFGHKIIVYFINSLVNESTITIYK